MVTFRAKTNYLSIADFRKVNPVALQNTFKLFVLFLKEAQLIGAKAVAIDGTKVRAFNSKKNNFNPQKIERHLAYIETKTAEYLKQLCSEYAQAVEQNAKDYQNNRDLYRKRQEINEHIFGTIKRQWGYDHTNLRGLNKVNGEMALIMTVYNIKRSLNILGISELMAKLHKWSPDYEKATYFGRKRAVLSLFKPLKDFSKKQVA